MTWRGWMCCPGGKCRTATGWWDFASRLRLGGKPIGARRATRAFRRFLLGTAQAGLPKFRIADMERDVELMRMARADARLIMERDPKLETDRGKALRNLLYLMGADDYIGLLQVG